MSELVLSHENSDDTQSTVHERRVTAHGGLSVIAVIEPRMLVRECIVCALARLHDFRTIAVSSASEWLAAVTRPGPDAILLGVRAAFHSARIATEVAALRQAHSATPLILISDTETPEEISTAFNLGVRGFIPTSMGLTVAVHAIRLVVAGGEYVPAQSLIGKKNGERSASGPNIRADYFTTRQAEIVKELCRGKPNKVIAYELKMCESTVKVHVRNIMKKLKAKNRTEVVILARDLLVS